LQGLRFRSDAGDDVTQNVFVKLYRGGVSYFRGKAKYEFFSYFRVIVKNEAISYANARRGEDDPIPVTRDDPDGTAVEDRILDMEAASRPDMMVESKETVDLVRGVIKSLPVEDQEINHCKEEDDGKGLHAA
jgi:RNA polymerase sigma factor (sigma-70 family)